MVSTVIVLIMIMIVGNTIAMGVRERTREYGVLRAIGFRPKHLLQFVFGETATLIMFGGAFGYALTFLALRVFSQYIETHYSQFITEFTISTSAAASKSTKSRSSNLCRKSQLSAIGRSPLPRFCGLSLSRKTTVASPICRFAVFQKTLSACGRKSRSKTAER